MPEREVWNVSAAPGSVCGALRKIGGWGAVRKIGRRGEGGERQTDSVEDKGAF